MEGKSIEKNGPRCEQKGLSEFRKEKKSFKINKRKKSEWNKKKRKEKLKIKQINYTHTQPLFISFFYNLNPSHWFCLFFFPNEQMLNSRRGWNIIKSAIETSAARDCDWLEIIVVKQISFSFIFLITSHFQPFKETLLTLEALKK